jgi:hypothetical protein
MNIYSLLTNNNSIIVNYFLEHPELISDTFSENNNDFAVDYLLNNPDKIYYPLFSKNNNTKAVKHLLNNYALTDELISSTSKNNNDIITINNNFFSRFMLMFIEKIISRKSAKNFLK